MPQYTPMMQQYFKVKEQYPDAVLFYRLGDFYEMFFDDADIASRELELVLTSRDCGMPERAPMCGVPYHAAESYIAKLISKGYKVAVAEQLEEPTAGKIVTRDVIRVHTPGTVIESSMLDEGRNNYLACVYAEKDKAGLCAVDVSTGKLFLSVFDGKDFENKTVNGLARYTPSEILINSRVAEMRLLNEYITKRLVPLVEVIKEDKLDYAKCAALTEKHYGKSVSELGLGGRDAAVIALGATLDYLIDVQKTDVSNLNEPELYKEDTYMNLDATARRNLELCETQRRREKKGSLLWTLDYTKTPMGKRLIRSWIEQPLLSVPAIISRQNAVRELVENTSLRDGLVSLLTGANDIERIIARAVYGTANAKDLKALSQTLMKIPPIKDCLKDCKSKMLCQLNEEMDALEDISGLIDSAICDEPPFSVREGNMIKKGFNKELDSLHDLLSGGKGVLADIEKREQAKTQIKKLKIGYNRVFGYYIEVLNAYKELVPDEYIRKQTLSNCERFITPELKELEAKVLGAQERIVSLEYEIFTRLRNKVSEAQYRLKRTADAAASLDTLCSFASAAVENGYECPEVDNSDVIIIKDGRHPVVEKFLDGAPFVPNDTSLDCGKNRTAIITGPNMAGKSTYMRQVAVIVLMAQIGSFVPAKSARIGVVDSIFTRVGAADDLSAGQSTFMLEMSEVASIIKNATSKSLIILDEIGRGTSTYDGMSIARAVLEYVSDKKKLGAKTLFATHYHELTSLENETEGIKNYNTSVKKRGENITFLRRIVPGCADGSFGVEVASLAGVPKSIVSRAREILNGLESGGNTQTVRTQPPVPSSDSQISFESGINDEIAEEIKRIDVNTLSPIEALTKLYELKKKIES